jgi:hypothetical protein
MTFVNVQAKIESCPDDTIPVGKVFVCQTRDLSIEGICLMLEESLPVGCIVKLMIEFSSSGKKFEHLSHVSWCKKYRDDYLAGLQLTKNLGDENAWKPEVINILIG